MTCLDWKGSEKPGEITPQQEKERKVMKDEMRETSLDKTRA